MSLRLKTLTIYCVLSFQAINTAGFIILDRGITERRTTRTVKLNVASEKETLWWRSTELKDHSLAEETRKEFPILNSPLPGSDNKELVYLDSAATSQKPTFVTDALTSYYNKYNSNVHRGAHTLSREATSLYEAARDSVAKFINAYSRNEIVFTAGATEALNLVASTYGRKSLEKGDEIIASVTEHHSNIVPWHLLQEEKGVKLKFVPLTEDRQTLDLEVFESLITEKTKLVSIQHASNVMGYVNPIDKIVKLVREKAHPDCKIILDACQSVPHMPVDVQSLGVDFVCASGHKMCGPTGIGFLWGREALLNDDEKMPPYQGGGEMIEDVYLTHSTFARAPGKFEAGTPAIAQAIGLGAACNYLMNIGMDRIHEYELEIGQYLYKRMSEVDGITILGPLSDKKGDRTAIVAFVCDNVHPSDLSTFLDMEGVAIRAGHHCCQPLHRELGYSHSARASLYFYNTKEEVDSFIQALEETLQFFTMASGSDDDDDLFIEKDDDIFV